MKRLNDEDFINTPETDRAYTYDDIIAIRIENGNLYFLGWMEDAENHAIQIASDYHSCMLDRGPLVGCGELVHAIVECDGYDNIFYDWETDENGNIRYDADKKYRNAYECFLSYVRCYERNGVSDSEDHDIFLLTKEELSSFIDAFRDGDYIFILQEDNQNAFIRRKFAEAAELYADESDFYRDLLDSGITIKDVQAVMGEDTAVNMLKFCITHGIIDERSEATALYDAICQMLKANSNNAHFFWVNDDDEICCENRNFALAIADLFSDLGYGLDNMHTTYDEDCTKVWSVYPD